jgi:hypothetical protein
VCGKIFSKQITILGGDLGRKFRVWIFTAWKRFEVSSFHYKFKALFSHSTPKIPLLTVTSISACHVRKLAQGSLLPSSNFLITWGVWKSISIVWLVQFPLTQLPRFSFSLAHKLFLSIFILPNNICLYTEAQQ